jgi:hypothetical protein
MELLIKKDIGVPELLFEGDTFRRRRPGTGSDRLGSLEFLRKLEVATLKRDAIFKKSQRVDVGWPRAWSGFIGRNGAQPRLSPKGCDLSDSTAGLERLASLASVVDLLELCGTLFMTISRFSGLLTWCLVLKAVSMENYCIFLLKAAADDTPRAKSVSVSPALAIVFPVTSTNNILDI